MDLTSKISSDWIASYGLIIVSAFLDSFAAYAVKDRLTKIGGLDFSTWAEFLRTTARFIESPVVILALFGFLVAPALWFFALNRIQLSVGYLFLVSFHVLFILTLSVFFLHEVITVRKILAALFLVVSVFLVYEAP